MNVVTYGLALAAAAILFALYAWLVAIGKVDSALFVSDVRNALLAIAALLGAGHVPGRFSLPFKGPTQ